jgi:N-acetylneuraminic acid mutarotase
MITRYNVITRDILRYSISDDQIRKVSSMMTDSGEGLAVQGSDNKYIYYFGGTSAYTLIQRFDTETTETRQLSAELPSPIMYASGLSNKDGTIFIYNGYTRDIIQFEEASETANVIADLPFQSDPQAVFSAAAIPNGKENVSIWLFAGNNPKVTNPILLFNTVTKTVSIPTGNKTSQFPTLYETPATVTDNKDGYIIGGFGRVAERNGSYHPTNGILK